jgi:hypothetical protein
VLRGGSFFGGDDRHLRADGRRNLTPGGRSFFIGFRLVKLSHSTAAKAAELKVFVNDSEIPLTPGMTVTQALLGADLMKEIADGKKAYDEWGNELGLSGELTDGVKIIVR